MTNTLCWDRDLQRIYITAGPGSSRRRGLESAVVTEDMECLAGLEVSGWGGGLRSTPWEKTGKAAAGFGA